jgi:hypothetical protein
MGFTLLHAGHGGRRLSRTVLLRQEGLVTCAHVGEDLLGRFRVREAVRDETVPDLADDFGVRAAGFDAAFELVGNVLRQARSYGTACPLSITA